MRYTSRIGEPEPQWNRVEPEDKQIVGIEIEVQQNPKPIAPSPRVYENLVARYDKTKKVFVNLAVHEDGPWPLSEKEIDLLQVDAWKPIF